MCPRGGFTFGWPSVSSSTAAMCAPSAPLFSTSSPVWGVPQICLAACHQIIYLATAVDLPASSIIVRSSFKVALELYAPSEKRSGGSRSE